MEEEEILEMDEILEQILGFSIDEAKEGLIQTGTFTPFTVIVENDNMHIESHPGEPESIRINARDQVKTASSFATHYTFCYDGYIETDDGTLDAIIVECAARDMEESYVIALIYREEEDTLTFDDALAYVGPGEMFFDLDIVKKAEDAEFEEAQRKLGNN